MPIARYDSISCLNIESDLAMLAAVAVDRSTYFREWQQSQQLEKR